MLIQFHVANFRSIRDEQILSMVAGKLTGHEESNTIDIAQEDIGRLLRSSVIYGPNAAGKTNLLKGVQFVQSLVVNSANKQSADQYTFSPFRFDNHTKDSQSQFRIVFVQNGKRYEYGVSLSVQRIENEWLTEYSDNKRRSLYKRMYDANTGAYKWQFSRLFRGGRQRSLWRDATRADALFLSTAAQLNSEHLTPVFEWFSKRLVVIVGVSVLNPTLTLQLLEQENGKAAVLPFLREADPWISDVKLQKEPVLPVQMPGIHFYEQLPGQLPTRVKVDFLHNLPTGASADFRLEDESSGTQILFRIAGPWLNSLRNGEVLLIDEVDTSLHPKLVRYLIQLFHSERNAKNAQLLFTTHNTSFLDQELFRRDQIWFVEKGSDAATKLYPLTDFNPRNDEVLEKWYLRGRYGALPILHEL